MDNIKSFLGFTNTIKEPRKTKVEDTLSNKIYDTDNKIYNKVTFILNKVLEGRKPLKVENIITYNKRTGEENKPKTEYRLINNENSFFEMNKTEYDFCVYCVDAGYTNLETISKYILEEENKLKAIAEHEAELERIQEEKICANQKEIESTNIMLIQEIETLPQEEKNIMNSIYLSMLGMEADNRSYKFIAMIHHFDNNICKQNIISRLHNDNVASIKTFECITGLTLPKTNKQRIEYLNSITSNDFTGMVEYKERKKAEHKEVITEEFYINQRDNITKAFHWLKVIAEPYTKHGMDMFIQCIDGKYKISEVKTGSLLGYGKNKTEAKQNIDKIIQEKGKESLEEAITKMYNMIYPTAGDNPRYKEIS